MGSVTAIVPAYNEEKTIKHVLNTLVSHPKISQVICVNDASTDNTSKIAHSVKGIDVIDLKINKRKGNALSKGIEKAKGNIILFIDADLATLNHQHINTLINPILNKNQEAMIGYPGDYLTDSLFKSIGGQRCYKKKDIEPLKEEILNSGLGVEVLFNKRLKHLNTKTVKLIGLGHLIKLQKKTGWDLIKYSYKGIKEIIIQTIQR